MDERLRRLRLYAEKWPFYNRNSLPWNRLAIHAEFARRESFVRFPIDGNVLDDLRAARLEVGRHVNVEANVISNVLGGGHMSVGEYSVFCVGTMISVIEELE